MPVNSKFAVDTRVKKLVLHKGTAKCIHGVITRIGEHSIQVQWDNMSFRSWDFEENLEVSN